MKNLRDKIEKTNRSLALLQLRLAHKVEDPAACSRLAAVAPSHAIYSDAGRSVEDRVRNTVAKIQLAGAPEVKIHSSGLACFVRLEVTRAGVAAFEQCLVQRRRPVVFGKTVELDAVTHETTLLAPVLFVCTGAGVVRFVVDIAHLFLAFGVWCRRLWEIGDGGCRWVGVEDDLIIRADPAVVPLDDGGGLHPAGFVLAALIGVFGDNAVAGATIHDGTIVVPAIGTTSTAGGTIGRVVCQPVISCVLAAHVKDTAELSQASLFGNANRIQRVTWSHRREELDLAILLGVRPR